jgi:hypothetical protein
VLAGGALSPGVISKGRNLSARVFSQPRLRYRSNPERAAPGGEPMVRGLAAGGKRIRTGGPTSEPTPALIGKCSPHQLVASQEKATGSLRALSAVSAEKYIARLDRPALARPRSSLEHRRGRVGSGFMKEIIQKVGSNDACLSALLTGFRLW